VTLSDLFFLGAVLAAVLGVALLVGAFLGIVAAIGAGLVVLSAGLVLAALGGEPPT
jgi:hypothetical protein